MRIAVVALALAGGLLTRAAAETYLAIDSEVGDRIGNGQQLSFAEGSTFQVSREADNGVKVAVRMPTPINGKDYWQISLLAAGDRALVPGPYEDAHIRRYLTPTLYPPTLGAPTLDVRGPYTPYCTRVEGRFDLLEIEFGASGEVLRLAADVEQRCDGSSATLRASIRVNANPPFAAPPDSDADSVFDSMDNCVDIPNPEQTNGDDDLLGDACDDRFTRTLLAARIRTGGYREPTLQQVFDPRDGAFRVQRFSDGVEVRFAGENQILMRFGTAKPGEMLRPGSYDYATRDGAPWILVSGWFVAEKAWTRFVVHELEFAPDGIGVTRFSVDFFSLSDSFVGGHALGGLRYQASETPPGREDFDEDGVPDIVDNCRGATNPEQIDSDADFAGDVCDASLSATFVLLDSPPGEFIGRGLRQLFTTGDDAVVPTRYEGTSSRGNGVRFGGLDNAQGRWNVEMVAPDNQLLVAGQYTGAQRFPFQGPGRPGLAASGASRGCGTSTGRFEVREATYAPNSQIERFSADFEQLCDGAIAPLVGSVRFRSAFVPTPGDADGDGVLDASDNCPVSPNPIQTDGNRDGRGDACTIVQIDVERTWLFGILPTRSHLPVRVAFFGSEAVDVRDLVWEGLAFGPGRARPLQPPWRRDLDRDGFDDLLVQYDLAASKIAVGDTRACVSGNLGGQYFLACDAIDARPPGCGRGAEIAWIAPLPAWLWRRSRWHRRPALARAAV